MINLDNNINNLQSGTQFYVRTCKHIPVYSTKRPRNQTLSHQLSQHIRTVNSKQSRLDKFPVTSNIPLVSENCKNANQKIVSSYIQLYFKDEISYTIQTSSQKCTTQANEEDKKSISHVSSCIFRAIVRFEDVSIVSEEAFQLLSSPVHQPYKWNHYKSSFEASKAMCLLLEQKDSAE